MKKVLFTATVDSHILAFHLPFLKWFKDQGYEVHVATNGDEEIPYCDKKIKISFERSPFKLNNIKAIFQLRKILLEEKYDIIHTHTPMGSVVTRLAAKKSRKQGTRVIYTAHGFHFFKGAPLLNWTLFYPVEKYLSKYTDTLILINKEDYNLAKKKFKKCKDIQYVPGVGIDENKFDIKMTKKEKTELRKSLGLKDNDFVMIYPAELSNRKRQIWLINAVSTLLKENKDMHLLLPGKDSLNGKCQELVKELNLEKQIHFLGFRKDIPKLLQISDLSVSSSRQEGLPVNIMEAMYVEVPIVATDCRGNRDLVKDGENGYIVPLDDSEMFDERIKTIYVNKTLRKKLKKANKKEIKNYIFENILEDMKNIYQKKKTVLHILASNKFSGAENVACTIIENMNEDYNMIYCCPHGPIDETLIKKRIRQAPLNKFNIKNIKKAINNYHPDIIHAHDFRASCIVSFLKCNNTVISHIHQIPIWFTKLNMRTKLYDFCSRKFDKIVFVSNSIYKSYVYKEKIKNKTSILYNYVDEGKILRLSSEKYLKTYDACFFGRLSSEKNPLEFIHIIDEYKKKYNKTIKACMIGSGNLEAKCKSMISEKQLDNNIDLLGFQENPYKIVKKCKVVIMPSIYEGFGLAAIESVILNKPVLNSGAGGLYEIFSDTKYICNDTKDYLRKIYKIISQNLRINQAEREKIIEKYVDIKTWKKALENIYESETNKKTPIKKLIKRN